MKKITSLVVIGGALILTACAGTTESAGMEDKVQNKMADKATDKALGKVGLPGLKKEKTTEEKLTDVATGKTSATDVVTDMAADKAADIALKKVM